MPTTDTIVARVTITETAIVTELHEYARHFRDVRIEPGTFDRSIFSDDENAIEALEAKAAKLDAKAEQANAFNLAWRRAMKASAGDIDKAAAVVCAAFGFSEKTRDALAADARRFSCTAKRGPMSSSHERAEARRCRERIAEIKARAAKVAKAEAAGGCVVTCGGGSGDWCSVTFAEKPDRDILAALRAADFRWSAPSWHGTKARLPAAVAEMARDAAKDEATT